MIHMYIPLAICLVAFIITYKKAKGTESLLATLSAFGVVIFIILITLICNRPDLFLKIPNTSAVNKNTSEVNQNVGLNIGTFGTMLLRHTNGVGYSDEFILDDSTTLDDLINYIEINNRRISLLVQVGSKYVYNKSYSSLTEDDCSDILEIYKMWREFGYVPSNIITYKFLCFYFNT